MRITSPGRHLGIGGASHCNWLSGLHVRQMSKARVKGRTQKARMRPDVGIQVCLKRDVDAYSDESESLKGVSYAPFGVDP